MTTDLYENLANAIDLIAQKQGRAIGAIEPNENCVQLAAGQGFWSISTDGDYWLASFTSPHTGVSGILKIDADQVNNTEHVALALVTMIQF